MRVALIALSVNLLLSIASAWYLTSVGFAGPHVGLAGATSVAAMHHSAGWMSLLARVVAANAAMCAVLVQLHRPLEWWLGVGLSNRVYWLGVSVIAGGVAYFLALLILGMRPSQFRLRAG